MEREGKGRGNAWRGWGRGSRLRGRGRGKAADEGNICGRGRV